MAYSDLAVSSGPDRTVYLTARGGTRRQRAAVMAAWARKHPGHVRVAVTYSETHGFLPATYAGYREA